MTLPATFGEAVEAEALAFARDWIAWHRNNPNGIWHPDANTVYGKLWMKLCAQTSPFLEDDIVVYLAENGCEQADLAARELIAEYTDRGEELTAVLRAYNIRLINPMRKPKQSGPAKASNLFRDLGITRWIDLDCGRLQRTNRKTKIRPPSACSIAATALTEARINIPRLQGCRKGVGPLSGGVRRVALGSRHEVRRRLSSRIRWPLRQDRPTSSILNLEDHQPRKMGHMNTRFNQPGVPHGQATALCRSQSARHCQESRHPPKLATKAWLPVSPNDRAKYPDMGRRHRDQPVA